MSVGGNKIAGAELTLQFLFQAYTKKSLGETYAFKIELKTQIMLLNPMLQRSILKNSGVNLLHAVLSSRCLFVLFRVTDRHVPAIRQLATLQYLEHWVLRQAGLRKEDILIVREYLTQGDSFSQGDRKCAEAVRTLIHLYCDADSDHK
jgi:hypothetical protein